MITHMARLAAHTGLRKRPITSPVTWVTSTSNCGLSYSIRATDDDNAAIGDTVGDDNAAIGDTVGDDNAAIGDTVGDDNPADDGTADVNFKPDVREKAVVLACRGRARDAGQSKALERAYGASLVFHHQCAYVSSLRKSLQLALQFAIVRWLCSRND